MFCRFLLLFAVCSSFIIINVEGVMKIPDDLHQVPSNTDVNFKLLDNPFFLYVDYVAQAKNCPGNKPSCICYLGYDTSEHIEKMLIGELSSHEILTHMDTTQSIKKGPGGFQDGFCGNMTKFLTHRQLQTPKNYSDPIKWHHLHAGYGNSKFNEQKICIYSSSENMPPGEYKVMVKTTGNGLANKPHVATIKLTANKNPLILQFNTKKPVLQRFDVAPRVKVDYFVIPQIAIVKAFGDRVDETKKMEIEENFVQIHHDACSNTEKIISYSEESLKQSKIKQLPSSVSMYIGSLLSPAKGSNDVKKMYTLDRSKYDDLLNEEIKYQISHYRRKFEP